MVQILTEVLTAERVVALKELASRHGFGQVRVFGSYARGEPKAGSDLDLLVKIEDHRPGLADRFLDFCE